MTYIAYALLAACFVACVTSKPKPQPKIIWEDLNDEKRDEVAP